MPKRFTLFLSASPYAGEYAASAARLAGAALDEGHEVALFASGDGIYNFIVGQNAKGVPNGESEFATLMARGLTVELWGSCLKFRGARDELLMPGTKASSMRGLFAVMKQSDVFLTFG